MQPRAAQQSCTVSLPLCRHDSCAQAVVLATLFRPPYTQAIHTRAVPPPPLQIITLVQASDVDRLELPPRDRLPAGPFPGYARYAALLQACRAHDPATRPRFDAIVSRLRWAGGGDVVREQGRGGGALPVHEHWALFKQPQVGA